VSSTEDILKKISVGNVNPASRLSGPAEFYKVSAGVDQNKMSISAGDFVRNQIKLN
jgi:hypothetical protein